jgi:hypothetical protein
MLGPSWQLQGAALGRHLLPQLLSPLRCPGSFLRLVTQLKFRFTLHQAQLLHILLDPVIGMQG